MKKRSVKILSLVLALVMAFSLCPLQAFAAGGNQWGWGGSQGPEMPAQQLKATDNESGVAVSVNAPEGALPKGTTLNVKAVNLPAVQAIVDNDPNATGTVVAAVDITFYYEGTEIEPEKKVSVSLSSDAISNAVNPTVLHLDCSAEEIESGSVPVEIMGSGTSFSSSDFSVYAVTGQGDDLPLLTVEFYAKENGAWEKINAQAIRMDQISILQNPVFDPGVPTLTSTQSFEGWYGYNEEGTPTIDDDTVGVSVEDINTYVKDNYNAQSSATTLKYYAMVYDVRYVVYHDQAGAVLMTQSYHIHSGNTTESVKIDWSYVGFKGEQNFAGWVTEASIAKDTTSGELLLGDYPLYVDNLNTGNVSEGGDVYMNGATYSLSNTLDLYPYLNSGHWLIFDTYKDQDADATSTSYIGPVFYEEGKSTVAPTPPTRTGYEFKGWYKEKAFTNRFIFGNPISEDTTIYAKWEPQNTTYQVVFWQQNVTDAVDAADSAKTYSFYKVEKRGAITGSEVSLNLSESGTAADNRRGGNSADSIGEMGFYFSYNGTNSDTASAVVKGDGSTVLNVYYDRKVITYNFYGDLTSYSYSSSTYNSNYPYYGVDSSNNLFKVTRRSGYWYDASNTRYSGTVYHLTFDSENLSSNSADVQFGSIQGLYGSNMDYFDWSSASTIISGSDWPYSGKYLMWHDENTGRYLNKAFQYTTGEATTSTTINYYLNEYVVSSSTRPYTCMGQDSSGNYTITLDDESMKSTETLYLAGDEYYGYKLDRYNKTRDDYSSATVWDGKTVTCSYNDIGSNGHAYFYFARNKWDFVYESNNSSVKTENLYWEANLSGLANYVPTNGPEGYYFDGWYADPAFDTEFDFSQEMPNHNVAIYAKWTLERFRVVLDPTGGEQGVNASDITFPGNQATTFRVDYGELVQASSINNAQREGYTLLGWFLDKEYKTPFNFANPVTDAIADMTYAEASDEERQGVDPWNDNKAYDDADGEHDDVVGKVTIYAHWRQDPDGVVGINVKYLADDKDGNDGTFSQNNDDIWNDPNIYADQAQAFGQPASEPDNADLQFLYWEILDKYDNVVGKAYPGQLWTVDYNNAVEGPVNPSESVLVTYNETPAQADNAASRQTPVRSKPVPAPLNTGNREVTTLTTTLFSDNFDDGTAFTTSTSSSDTMSTETWTAYKVGNGNNWSNYYDSSYAHSGSRSARYEYSSSYAANCYLISHPFKVSSNASSVAVSLFERVYSASWAEQFEVFFIVTDGVTTTGNAVSATHYNVISSASYTNTTYAEKTGSPSNLDALKGKNVRLVIHCTSAADMARLYIDDVNVTETKTGETVTYELADEIEAGKDYIIVVGDTHAVLNSTYSNNRYINAASVVNNGDGTVTIFADQESSMLYRVGGSASGWTFYNQAAGKYLGLNASDSHWLSMISTGWEWLYTGTDLDNQCTDSDNQNSSGNAFRYLSYSTTYDDFTTSVGTGQNVKFYKIVNNGYTVKFMDPITNTQIGEDQIVPEGGSAVAPEAPDHTAQQKIFTGWDKPFDNITEDTVVTAVYVDQSSLSYTVTFRYMNSQGEWVSEEQTVQHGQDATAPTLPTPPTGYTFNSWDKKLTNITSNLTINAVYKQTATKAYTITLRAVYGIANKNALTHITWYGNNDGVTSGTIVQRDTGLKINGAITIPTPNSIYNGTVDHTKTNTLTAGELTYVDHVFLGWARLKAATGDVTGQAHPELGEDDLFLKWHPETSDFEVMKKDTTSDVLDVTTHVTMVAADEMQPYHDMYAVWGKVFYVYHSSTGTVERRVISATTGTGETRTAKTFDLTALVPDDSLYGGYYTDYAGKAAATSASLFTGNDAVATAAELDTPTTKDDTGARLYNAAMLSRKTTVDTVVTWSEDQAYTNAPGTAIVPVAGTTYYIKEVPAALYLRHYTHYTYRLGTNAITSLYMISAIDDPNYNSIGAVITNTATGDIQAVKSLTIKAIGGSGSPTTTVTYYPSDIFNILNNGTKGAQTYLTYIRCEPPTDDAAIITVDNYWVTLDGVTVHGATPRSISNATSAETIGIVNNPTP